ncbi:hypothetical protein OQA88_10636 [Cercophora sp. LCS_1]
MHPSTVFATLLLSSGTFASLIPRRGVPIELLGRDVDQNVYKVCSTLLCIDHSTQSCNVVFKPFSVAQCLTICPLRRSGSGMDRARRKTPPRVSRLKMISRL